MDENTTSAAKKTPLSSSSNKPAGSPSPAISNVPLRADTAMDVDDPFLLCSPTSSFASPSGSSKKKRSASLKRTSPITSSRCSCTWEKCREVAKEFKSLGDPHGRGELPFRINLSGNDEKRAIQRDAYLHHLKVDVSACNLQCVYVARHHFRPAELDLFMEEIRAKNTPVSRTKYQNTFDEIIADNHKGKVMKAGHATFFYVPNYANARVESDLKALRASKQGGNSRGQHAQRNAASRAEAVEAEQQQEMVASAQKQKQKHIERMDSQQRTTRYNTRLNSATRLDNTAQHRTHETPPLTQHTNMSTAANVENLPKEEIVRLLGNLPKEEIVRLLGNLPKEEIVRLLRGASDRLGAEASLDEETPPLQRQQRKRKAKAAPEQ